MTDKTDMNADEWDMPRLNKIDLMEENIRLHKELAEARKDTDRLEWLFLPIIPKTDKGEDAFATWHCAYTSRQAIDHAMEGQDE